MSSSKRNVPTTKPTVTVTIGACTMRTSVPMQCPRCGVMTKPKVLHRCGKQVPAASQSLEVRDERYLQSLVEQWTKDADRHEGHAEAFRTCADELKAHAILPLTAEERRLLAVLRSAVEKIRRNEVLALTVAELGALQAVRSDGTERGRIEPRG